MSKAKATGKIVVRRCMCGCNTWSWEPTIGTRSALYGGDYHEKRTAVRAASNFCKAFGIDPSKIEVEK